MYRVYMITIYDIRKYTIRIYTTTALVQMIAQQAMADLLTCAVAIAYATNVHI